MSRNTDGSYSRLPGSAPRTGDELDPGQYNAEMDDIATALSDVNPVALAEKLKNLPPKDEANTFLKTQSAPSFYSTLGGDLNKKPKDYPLGLTQQQVSGSNTGGPEVIGTCLTIKHSVNRVFQLFSSKSAALYVRAAKDDDIWQTDWFQIPVTSIANVFSEDQIFRKSGDYIGLSIEAYNNAADHVVEYRKAARGTFEEPENLLDNDMLLSIFLSTKNAETGGNINPGRLLARASENHGDGKYGISYEIHGARKGRAARSLLGRTGDNGELIWTFPIYVGSNEVAHKGNLVSMATDLANPYYTELTSSVTPDFTQKPNHHYWVKADLTINNPTGMKSGMSGVMLLFSTDARVVSWGSKWIFPSNQVPEVKAGTLMVSWYVESAHKIRATYVSMP